MLTLFGKLAFFDILKNDIKTESYKQKLPASFLEKTKTALPFISTLDTLPIKYKSEKIIPLYDLFLTYVVFTNNKSGLFIFDRDYNLFASNKPFIRTIIDEKNNHIEIPEIIYFTTKLNDSFFIVNENNKSFLIRASLPLNNNKETDFFIKTKIELPELINRQQNIKIASIENDNESVVLTYFYEKTFIDNTVIGDYNSNTPIKKNVFKIFEINTQKETDKIKEHLVEFDYDTIIQTDLLLRIKNPKNTAFFWKRINDQLKMSFAVYQNSDDNDYILVNNNKKQLMNLNIHITGTNDIYTGPVSIYWKLNELNTIDKTVLNYWLLYNVNINRNIGISDLSLEANTNTLGLITHDNSLSAKNCYNLHSIRLTSFTTSDNSKKKYFFQPNDSNANNYIKYTAKAISDLKLRNQNISHLIANMYYNRNPSNPNVGFYRLSNLDSTQNTLPTDKRDELCLGYKYTTFGNTEQSFLFTNWIQVYVRGVITANDSYYCQAYPSNNLVLNGLFKVFYDTNGFALVEKVLTQNTTYTVELNRDIGFKTNKINDIHLNDDVFVITTNDKTKNLFYYKTDKWQYFYFPSDYVINRLKGFNDYLFFIMERYIGTFIQYKKQKNTNNLLQEQKTLPIEITDKDKINVFKEGNRLYLDSINWTNKTYNRMGLVYDNSLPQNKPYFFTSYNDTKTSFELNRLSAGTTYPLYDTNINNLAYSVDTVVFLAYIEKEELNWLKPKHWNLITQNNNIFWTKSFITEKNSFERKQLNIALKLTYKHNDDIKQEVSQDLIELITKTKTDLLLNEKAVKRLYFTFSNQTEVFYDIKTNDWKIIDEVLIFNRSFSFRNKNVRLNKIRFTNNTKSLIFAEEDLDLDLNKQVCIECKFVFEK